MIIKNLIYNEELYYIYISNEQNYSNIRVYRQKQNALRKKNIET